MNKEELIKLAKEKCNNHYEDNRKWISVRLPVIAWPDGKYDLELISRPGSPCKGYILINNGTKTLRAFGVGDVILYKGRFI